MNIQRLIFRVAIALVMPFFALEHFLRKLLPKKQLKMGLLDIEFFHEEAGGFGGYGKSAKNITDHFNKNSGFLKTEVILTRPFKNPGYMHLHGTNIIKAVDPENSSFLNAIRYGRMLNKRNLDFLLTVEYCTDYQYSLFFLPTTPLILWIHDPRPKGCLEKIATVSLEVRATGIKNPSELEKHDQNIRESLRKVIRLSKIFNRKIVFTTTAHYLIERARECYALPEINPLVLPTPVAIPELGHEIPCAEKPSLCFLGRLDPIKRPWIFFELAKRFPSVDFVVLGKTHFSGIMDPIINKFLNVQNLKLLGFTDGEKKETVLRSAWAIVNTSIHEALPVSFLESFAFGKPIISCQNPDGFAEKFGIYTGEVLGDGMDEKTIDIFSNALSSFLSRREEMIQKGKEARDFVKANYSYERFEKVLKEILAQIK